jgi:hypothetical protein
MATSTSEWTTTASLSTLVSVSHASTEESALDSIDNRHRCCCSTVDGEDEETTILAATANEQSVMKTSSLAASVTQHQQHEEDDQRGAEEMVVVVVDNNECKGFSETKNTVFKFLRLKKKFVDYRLCHKMEGIQSK